MGNMAKTFNSTSNMYDAYITIRTHVGQICHRIVLTTTAEDR